MGRDKGGAEKVSDRDRAVCRAFGARLREQRIARGLTQEALGNLVGHVRHADLGPGLGMDRHYLGRVEAGTSTPSLITIWRLARALEVDLAVLMPSAADVQAHEEMPER